MDKAWRDAEWGELAILEYGKGIRGYEQSGKPYCVYGTNGPIGTHDAALSNGPTVVVGRKGAYRGIHYSSAPCYVIDTAFYLTPRVSLDMRWAYYALLTQDINGMDSGSAIPSTSREAFYRLPVRVPPLDQQRAIASILGALDDKIDLNRKMSATLEAIARALFKSWFVDFDPVRAKAEGRDPGLPTEIAALFPNALDDSDFGPIPRGWQIRRIEEIGKVVTGKTPSTFVAGHFNGPYPFITIPDLDGRMHVDRTSRTLSDQGADAIKSSRLPAGAVLMSCIATVGRCGITERASFTNQQINAVICNSEIDPEFLYWAFRHLRQEVENVGGGGSVYTNVSKSRFANIRVLVPPHSLQAIFAGPWFSKLKNIVRENETLATLRDALLPKLISGELRVGDAERMLAASA